MIISEKQIIQLIQIAHVYLNALETFYKFDKTILSALGLHNRIDVAKILMEIANQQSEELKEVNE